MVVMRLKDRIPRIFIDGIELDLVSYGEYISRTDGHTISITFPADFAEWAPPDFVERATTNEDADRSDPETTLRSDGAV